MQAVSDIGVVQGAWWSDCQDAAAAFVVDGRTYSGDFLGRHPLRLREGVLVLEHGLPEGHGLEVTQVPLGFRILHAARGRLVLRPLPGNPYVGDWTLVSCTHEAPE